VGGADNRGVEDAKDRDTEGIEVEGNGEGVNKNGRKRVLEYFELEKTHLIATNLSYLTFLRHIFSHIHNY